eukprot:CAMPEP_0195299730 /NCGR_PEP_ID=MMETSP0707-20130614/26082_1 /TAXON_ID=33640 /ORGANISM="Asterionellopsis glacialis, Strain CCMP134" /LENGTH=322 /DNA_ID=CAMNT_0040362209 /DNA_START=21 /DNA_END=989 /DNA_ORIENTATION=+
MPRRSLIGLLANVFAMLAGIRMDTKSNATTSDTPPNTKIHNESGTAQLMHIGSMVAKLIDIADIAIDCAFVVELARSPSAEYRYWSIWMGCTIVLGLVLSRISYHHVLSNAIDHYGYGSWNYAYYFGTSGLIIFWIEDTTTIFLYADKPGAFDETHIADILNILSTLASAAMVSIFILGGGMKLVWSSSSSSLSNSGGGEHYWIPDLVITRFVQQYWKCWNTHRIMNILIVLKCIWVVVSMGFFGFLVFAYVLKGKVISGSLALATRIIYSISMCMGIFMSLRLPQQKTTPNSIILQEQDGILKQQEEGQQDDSTSSTKQVV